MTIPPLQSHTSAAPGPRPRKRSQQGFSLVECVLSVGITSTSLLGVVGMLMGALVLARDSKEETVSGVLIRQLAGELRDLPPAAAPGAEPQPLILLLDEAMTILKHSRTPADNVLSMYSSGTGLPNASVFARVDRVPDPEDLLMDRIVIRVESPASAPPAARVVRRYAALSPK